MEAKPLLSAKELAELVNDAGWGHLPPMLSPQDIATALKIPLNTVYNWSSQGLLDNCKVQVGKRRRFVRDKFFQRLINEGLHGD